MIIKINLKNKKFLFIEFKKSTPKNEFKIKYVQRINNKCIKLSFLISLINDLFKKR